MSRLKIAVVGAECTGKSVLTRSLASQLNADLETEYLRTFCDQRGRTPTVEEQGHILDVQIKHEVQWVDSASRADRLVVDSAPLVTALYSVFYFADQHWLERAIDHHRSYACTLLSPPDLPWVADGVHRDGPDVRQRFHDLLLKTLQDAELPFQVVSGEGDSRLESALKALSAHSLFGLD